MTTMRALIDIVDDQSTTPQLNEDQQVLREMPYVQDAALDFGLQDIEENAERAKDLLSRNPQKLYEQSGYTLYRLGADHGFFFMIDDDEGLIVYFIEYEQTVLKNFVSGVTQIKLWRSQTFGLSGVTKKVFFEYLLTEFGCVISDEAQTIDGKKFWIGAMGAAVRSGLTVGFYDDGEIFICEGSYAKWLQQQDAWGDDLRYFQKRFFIKSA